MARERVEIGSRQQAITFYIIIIIIVWHFVFKTTPFPVKKKKFAQEEKVILRSREENRCFSSGRA